MWRIFNAFPTYFWIAILCLCSLNINAQYPMGDTLRITHTDSVRIQDSIKKYTLAHIDTQYFDLTKNFNPIPFTKDLTLSEMKIQTPQVYSKFSFFLLAIVLCIAIITLVKILYPTYFSSLYNFVSTFNLVSVSRESASLNVLGAYLLNAVFIISTSISIYVIVLYFNMYLPDKLLFFQIIFIVILVYYSFKLVSLKFLNSFFKDKIGLEYYVQSISRTNQLTAIILSILLFIYFTGANNYDTLMVYILIIIIICSQLVIVYKGFMANIQFILPNFFHFIIYICTLEIAPFVILIKLYNRQVI